MGLFSPEHPCRCGYQGEGFHRCHVGRPDPNGTGEDGSRWCPHPAEFLEGKEYPTEVSDEGAHSR